MNANNNIKNIYFSTASERIIFQNKILRNTYLLLSACLILCFTSSFFTVFLNIELSPIALFLVLFALSFIIPKYKDSYKGLIITALYTIVTGLFVGQVIINYLYNYTNAIDIIFTSGILTAAIFFSLSGYALFTKKDFSFLKGFTLILCITILFGIIVSLFFPSILLQLIISSAIILMSSTGILYKTSDMVLNQGENNYILISLSLFMDIINLFLSLLRIMMIFSGRRD